MWVTVLLAMASPGALARSAPGWEEAKKAVPADYARQQPGDKVLEITGPERRKGR